MELIYASEKLKVQCENLKSAKKLFSGNSQLALSLLSRINALEQADVINDIVHMPPFHFHKLNDVKDKKYKGYFAIDVRNRKDGWRIILQPLDSNKEPFDPCNIDQIAKIVKIVEIKEVTYHYE